MATGLVPDFVVIHRMVSGIDSFPLLAVPFFILAGNLMNSAGITNRIYNFALALVGWLRGRSRACQRHRLDDLRRHVGHCDRRCSGARNDRDQGDEGSRLRPRVCGRRHRGVGDAGADHSAVVAVRDLRDVRQRLGRRAVSGGHPARCRDGVADDGDRRVLCAQEQVGRRHRVRMEAHRQGTARIGDRGRISDSDLARDAAGNKSGVDGRDRRLLCCWRPIAIFASTRCCRS